MNLWATVDRYGITAPALVDILNELQNKYRSIFGQDIYLESDSQDGQFLGIIAQEIANGNAAMIDVYNGYSPHTAQGVELSNTVKLNGLRRHAASHSTVDVEISGIAGTTINNGIISDGTNSWDLPSQVVINTTGVVTVTATAQATGTVQAAPNTITTIRTPTRGWQAVTNPQKAVAGANLETDASLRQRQAISTALPSQTVMEGITGAVANVSSVTRYRGYENSSNTADSNGIPPHTIAIVAEGGTDNAIATAINNKKTPGTGTVGNTAIQVTDPVGMVNTINFYRPTQVTINVDVALTALPGYLSTTGQSLQQAVADFINSQQIGSTIYHGQLYGPANLDGGTNSDTFNITSLTLGRGTTTPSVNNIALAFDEIAVCSPSNVTLTVS